ncbi:hypothetical protein ABNQ38_33905 (plasmid) [Azospirillum sp. A29]|uniref:hypothetical protein n=1 Tax=Azospirillum sp. A29 TaxID=3160606 RepID=UPI00366ABC6F
MPARAEEDWEVGRYREVAARAPKASGRVGRGGRTFHARVTSITHANGGARRAAGGLDYDARVERHRSRADELESEGGQGRAEMRAALDACADATTRKNGVVARRVIAELPCEMDAAARRAVAERIAAWFEQAGHPAHWAVHARNGKGEYQPHLHMTVAARHCSRRADGAWEAAPAGRSGVKGGGGARPVLAGPAALRAWRREVVAAAINAVAEERGIQLAAAWHGGRLAETGIDRPAKRRRPEVALRAPDRARASDHGLGLANRMAESEADAVRQAREAHVAEQRRCAAGAAAAARHVALAMEVAAVRAGRGRVSAARMKPILDQLLVWKDRAERLRATIAEERARTNAPPPSPKQRQTAADLATQLEVELPDGWDVTAGAAGAAVRLLMALRQARRVAHADKQARAMAEQERDRARQEAAAVLARPPLVREVVREVERTGVALDGKPATPDQLIARLLDDEDTIRRQKRELDVLRQRPDPADLQQLAGLLQYLRKTPNGKGAWTAEWVKSSAEQLLASTRYRGIEM